MAVPTHRTIGSLPEGIGDEMLYECMTASQLRTVEDVSTTTREQVQSFYKRKYPSDVLDAYQISQNSQEDGHQKKALCLKERAVSLIEKTDALVGGKGVLNRATGNGRASGTHHDVQQELAEQRWNAKAVGLIAFLKLVPEARDLLERVKAIESSQGKYLAMREWLKTQTPALTEARIVRIREQDVSEYVRPTFFPFRGTKVLNCIPRAVQFFRNLIKLELQNNLLCCLPARIARLGLQELDLSFNSFQKMPPVIKTLRRLNIQCNQVFQFDDIQDYIRNYIRDGGRNLTIFMDQRYASLRDFRALIQEVEVEGTHTISVSNENSTCVIRIYEQIPETLPLSQEFD